MTMTIPTPHHYYDYGTNVANDLVMMTGIYFYSTNYLPLDYMYRTGNDNEVTTITIAVQMGFGLILCKYIFLSFLLTILTIVCKIK